MLKAYEIHVYTMTNQINKQTSKQASKQNPLFTVSRCCYSTGSKNYKTNMMMDSFSSKIINTENERKRYTHIAMTPVLNWEQRLNVYQEYIE